MKKRFILLSAVVIALACSDEQAKAKPQFVHKEPTKPGVIAKINGVEVTANDLIGNDSQMRDLAKKTYMAQVDGLDRKYMELYLAPEAKKAGLTLDQYIDQKVLGGKKPSVSDKEYKKFLVDRRIPEAQVDAATKGKIMDYLSQLKRNDVAVAAAIKMGKGNKDEIYIERPRFITQVDPGNGPSFGPKDAKVTIVEFSDFQCPFCSRAAETVNQVKKKYGNKIRLVFRHYPLPNHPQARPTSEASLCVNEQSTDKFWKFHDLAFKNQDKLDAASLEKYAKESGADVAKFNECVKANRFADKVTEDSAYGNSVGVAATPTFYINGELLDGAQPIENFSEIIDEALKAKSAS